MFKICRSFLFLVSLFLVGILKKNACESRYLPTRSQDDRLARLKELIKELLRSPDELESSINMQQPRDYATPNKRALARDGSFAEAKNVYLLDENYIPESYDSSSSNFPDSSIPMRINHFQQLRTSNEQKRLRRNSDNS